MAVAPANAKSVAFNLADGAVVNSPVHLEFQVDGMDVKPASAGVEPSAFFASHPSTQAARK